MQEEICKLLLVVGNLEPGNKDLGTGILKLGLGICDKNMGPALGIMSLNRVDFKVAFRTRIVGRFLEIILHGTLELK